MSSSDQVDSSINNPPVPAAEPLKPEPIAVACQQSALQDDITNNAGYATHGNNDVTSNAEAHEEQKTYVSTTTFTLSSS